MNTLHFNDTAFQLNTIIQQWLCAGPCDYHDGNVGLREGRELCAAPWEVLVMMSAWHVLALGVVHFSKGTYEAGGQGREAGLRAENSGASFPLRPL